MAMQEEPSLRVATPRVRPLKPFQWILEHTALGGTSFGLRHSGHLRRSTFQPMSLITGKLERLNS